MAQIVRLDTTTHDVTLRFGAGETDAMLALRLGAATIVQGDAPANSGMVDAITRAATVIENHKLEGWHIAPHWSGLGIEVGATPGSIMRAGGTWTALHSDKTYGKYEAVINGVTVIMYGPAPKEEVATDAAPTTATETTSSDVEI